jgi:Na+-driven multidrug efflux pump
MLLEKNEQKKLKEIKKAEKKLNKINNKIAKLNRKKEINKLDQYNIEKLKISKICEEHILQTFKSKDYDVARVEKALTGEKKRRYQILNGNMLSTILMICIPLAVYAFFNSMYNLIDQIMASQISKSAVSNIAVISQLKNSISAFGAGIAGGGAVLVARYYGSGELEHARKASANMLFVSVLVSAIILLIIIPLNYPILKIAQTPEINFGVSLYFNLCMVELIFTSINSIFMGLEKIKGNSKKLLFLNILMLLIKLLFNVIFIYGVKVDSIFYLEISSIIGQFTLFAIGIFVMFGKKNMLQIKISNMCPKKLYLVPIIKLSIPIFLGKFVMNLGKAVVNGLCGSFYGEATQGLITGALGISNKLTGLVTSTTGVFEEGQSSVVSQNIGNRNLARTTKAFKASGLVVTIICLIGFILVSFVFLNPLTDLFAKAKADDDILKGQLLAKLVKEIYFYDCWSIPALGLTSVLLGLLYGYGKTFLSSILNFSRIGIRIITLAVCHSAGMNYTAAGLSMGISNVLIAILSLIFLIVFLRSLKKHGYANMKITDQGNINQTFIL